MKNTTLRPHIRKIPFKKPIVFSVLAHLLLLITMALGTTLFKSDLKLKVGVSGDVGFGDSYPIALAPELTGGIGNFAPSMTKAPEALAPINHKELKPSKELPKFLDPKKEFHEKLNDPPPLPNETTPGVIPGKILPGIGGPIRKSENLNSVDLNASGLSLGTGKGNNSLAGWYVRQLEQRIARNWLKARLGSVTVPIITRVSFKILPDGQIQNVQILESSDNPYVDRAALRAIQASSNLPPLPMEFQGHSVEFVAYFKYPNR